MCGRYVITSNPEAMRQLFAYEETPNFPPRYNIAPGGPVPIVRRGHARQEGGRREFALVRWGLVPSWSRQPPRTLLINARSETIGEKPSFRGAFRHYRCLMPADGFYEWRREGKGPAQPYFIRRRDGSAFAMAAIWDNWLAADGSEIETCAVVTTAANETLKPIHLRMPVILDETVWDDWLDPATPLKEVEALLKPAPRDLLDACPVSTRVNRVANDDAGLLIPVSGVPAPPAGSKGKSGEADRDKRNDQMDLF